MDFLSFSVNYSNIITRILLFLLPVLSAPIVSGQQNPFEVVRRNQTSVVPVTLADTTSANDSIKDTQTIARKTGQKIASILSEQKNALRVDSLNPFEVDHVPVKRLRLTNKNLTPSELEKGHHAENRFVFWYLLLSCLLLAIILNTRIRLISLSYSSLLNPNMMRLFLRDEGSRSGLYLFILYAIFWINATTVFYYTGLRMGLEQGHTSWLIILGVIIVLLCLRHAGLYLFGKIFLVTRDTVLYSFTIMIYYIFLGIILISFNIIVAFGPEPWHNILLNITLSIFVLFVFVRFIMGLRIISAYLSNRLFQTFLYLCTFEIVPVLILIKSFLNFSESFG